jgi:sugar/nucleoside kinase (ribokinase family)
VFGTAGAGDSFTSTLVAALAEGADADEALAQASVNAAAVIGAVDTTSGLLSREALVEQAAKLPHDEAFRLFK